MARVQVFQFSVTFGASTTATYTIGSGAEVALTDVTNAFMTFGVEGAVNDAASGQISGEITNTTTLTFTRVGTTGTPTIKGYVVEDTDLSVDHITISGFTDATEVTSALSEVDTLAKAFTLASGRDTATATSGQSTFAARLLDSSGLKAGVVSGVSGSNVIDAVAVQAVQYTYCSVQRGALTDMGSGTSQTQAVSTVDLSKSFCQAWYRTTDTSSIEPGDIGLEVEFTSTTEITISRGNGTDCNLDTGQYEAVSFTNAITVQEVNEVLAAASGSGTNALSTLSDSGANAVVIGGCGMFGYTGKTTFDSSDLFGEMQASAVVTSATNVTVARGATTGQLEITVFVLDWDPSSPPVNTVPVDTGGLFVTSDSSTVVADIGPATPMSVAEGTSPVTSVSLAVPVGKGTWTLTASGSVLLAGNGTRSVLLTNGASISEYNTVLATASFQGATDVHEKLTVSFDSSDGTLSDNTQFTILNDVKNLTLTVIEANFANLVTATASTQMRLDVGSSIGTCVVTATDADALTDEQTVTLVDNNPPVITSNGGTATAEITVTEGGTAVTTVTATDEDVGDTITFSISGGDDSSLFSIGSSSGVLTFNTPPVFDTPIDANADNVYEVVVLASDGVGSDTQILSITVVANQLGIPLPLGIPSDQTLRLYETTKVYPQRELLKVYLRGAKTGSISRSGHYGHTNS